MPEILEQINSNLKSLDYRQLVEVADFTAYLKVKSKITKSQDIDWSVFKKFEEQDYILSESGIDEYNNSLIIEDNL